MWDQGLRIGDLVCTGGQDDGRERHGSGGRSPAGVHLPGIRQLGSGSGSRGGTPRSAWEPVLPAIAGFTRVLCYDRAGLGESEPAPRPRTCHDFVSDLEGVLAHNRIPGPYLLVGHSFGGHILRYFASQHPDEAAGMVLVDSVHPEQNRRARALLPPPSPDDNFRLKAMRHIVTVGYVDDPQFGPEGIDLFACDEQVRAAGSLGDLPMVVLTAGKRSRPADLPPGLSTAYEQMFNELQADLARLSTRGRQIIAKHSGHFIHEDEPELVVAAIREMVEQARRFMIED